MSTIRSLGLLTACLSAAFAPTLVAGCASDSSGEETEPWTSYTTSTTTTTTTTSSTQTCPTGQTLCNGECTILEIDPDNCGACNTACGADQVCANSACGSDCTGGTTKCGAVCVNTDTDQQHCGECDHPCPAGQVCDGYGRCILTCADGLTQCGDACVNTDTDQAHCGECDNPCDDGQVCDGEGVCGITCGTSLVLCEGACINPLTDEDYCGATGDCAGDNAGDQCAGAEVCQAGSCNAVVCNDQWELTPNANDTEATAESLSAEPIGDCDGNGDQLSGVIDGPHGDVDWYYYLGDDTFGCNVGPYVAVTEASAAVRACVFLQCVDTEASLTFDCPEGTIAATSLEGRFGCCAEGTDFEYSVGGINCTGTTNEDLHVFIAVDDPQISAGTCSSYVLEYHY